MGYAVQGTALNVSDEASPEVYTALGGVTAISGPAMERAVIDDTDLADSVRVFIDGGVKDPGEVTVELSYDPSNANTTTLRGLLATGAARSFQIVGSGSPTETWAFDAFVTAFSVNHQLDDKATASLTLRINSDGSTDTPAIT